MLSVKRERVAKWALVGASQIVIFLIGKKPLRICAALIFALCLAGIANAFFFDGYPDPRDHFLMRWWNRKGGGAVENVWVALLIAAIACLIAFFVGALQ